MTKTIEFENGIDDLISDTFETLAELKEAIRYYGNMTIASLLAAHIETYEEMEAADK